MFHVWSAGMDYDDTGFSPYTAGMAAAYQYAMEAQRARVEGGRLNARIKARLGLHPLRLYAILSEDLDPPATAGAAPAVDARAAFAARWPARHALRTIRLFPTGGAARPGTAGTFRANPPASCVRRARTT